MAQWSIKAFRAGQDWSIARLSEFNVLYDVDQANQIWFLISPKECYITLYTYSGRGGTGVPTAHNFGPGTRLIDRLNVDEFNSWQVIRNVWHQ